MHRLFDAFYSYILNPDESNFDEVSSAVTSLHALIQKRYNLDLPKMVPQRSAIKSNVLTTEIPEKGRNREEVLELALGAFDNLVRWHHPYSLHNITPPPLLDSVAIRTFTSLYNPNCLWDFVSGDFLNYEKNVVDQISQLFGWYTEKSHGLFTFGGKVTLIYAVKTGINNCFRDSVEAGLNGGDLVVLTSEPSHYSLEYICSLLGIGKSNCIRIDSDSNGVMDAKGFESTFRQVLSEGKKVACIVLCGGNSLNNSIDPIKTIKDLSDSLALEYNLDYKPHIHVDSVIGWVWLFYKYYDFLKNSLNLETSVLGNIETTYQKISEISYADSAGIDFHKTGFCPYITSLFIAADKSKLVSLNSKTELKGLQKDYGDNFVQHFAVEHSRSGEGILSAWIALQELGIDGFQRYIAQMIIIRELIKRHLDVKNFEVINPEGHGFAVVAFPKNIPFFKGSFADLKTADTDTIRKMTDYCRNFFKYTSLDIKNQKNPIIGFIPNYGKSFAGVDLPALKLYPMLPTIEEIDLQQALARLALLKKEFDKKISTINTENSKNMEIVYPK